MAVENQDPSKDRKSASEMISLTPEELEELRRRIESEVKAELVMRIVVVQPFSSYASSTSSVIEARTRY